MQVTDILAEAQDGKAYAHLAEAFGIAPSEAKAAVGAVVPQLAQRIERNSFSRGGIAGILAMIGNPEFQKVLADPAALATPETQKLGIGVLDEVLWSKDKSRALAARASAETGLSETLIKSLLPTIAAMVAGGLAKGSSGALGEILGKLTGAPLPLPGEAPAAREIAHETPPAQRPAPRPASGDVGQQSPLPIPGERMPRSRRGRVPDVPGGEDNPYGDLSDIIRRGGYQIPPGRSGTGGVDGGMLGNIVRSILAGLLGYQNRGFIAWLVNLIVVRIGWGILKRILSRIFLGR